MKKKLETYYNLPSEVKFCSICVNSNQYPASVPEFQHSVDRKNANYVNFSDENICDACKWKQQRLLATYLIPGCIGRGVRLGFESSSGAA